MSIFMETTEIPVARTAAEISAYLADCGASKIMQEYGPNREISGIDFAIAINGKELYYSLPIRTEPVFRYMQHKRSPRTRARPESVKRDRRQAERTAWRQVLRWLEAQFALIGVGMAQTDEIFLPYMKVSPVETVFDRYKANNLLESGSERE